MANKEMIRAFKDKAIQIALRRKDPRFTKAIAFLVAKGLLDTNLPILPRTTMRLDVTETIWAGRNIEPRILEVLPAAVLHFPKNFFGMNKAPKEFLDLVMRIKKNESEGPDFEGIAFDKMKFWANNKLQDKRTRPANKKRRSKLFRLRPEILEKLEVLVTSGKFENQTAAIEAAIEKL